MSRPTRPQTRKKVGWRRPRPDSPKRLLRVRATQRPILDRALHHRGQARVSNEALVEVGDVRVPGLLLDAQRVPASVPRPTDLADVRREEVDFESIDATAVPVGGVYADHRRVEGKGLHEPIRLEGFLNAIGTLGQANTLIVVVFDEAVDDIIWVRDQERRGRNIGLGEDFRELRGRRVGRANREGVEGCRRRGRHR